jgi:nicotinate dehydrogenase subunit A
MDGQVAYLCDTPLWAVQGKQIITVEGLGTPDQPHPVVRALIAG